MSTESSQLTGILGEMCEGLGLSDEAIRELVERFMTGNETQLPLLEKACEAKEYEAIRSHANSLKGASAALKFDEMAEMAEALEMAAAQQEDVDYLEMFKAYEVYAQTIAECVEL